MSAAKLKTIELKDTTLRDYGLRLPIGVPDEKNPAQLSKGFELVELDYSREEELSKEKAKLPPNRRTQGDFVALTLALCLEKWGGYSDFKHKKLEHRIAILRNSYLTDVMYAWLMLRIETMGEEYALQITCGSCHHEQEWKADLDTIELTVCDGLPMLEFKLKKPVEYRNQKIVKAKIKALPWKVICRGSGDTPDLDAFKRGAMENGVYCFLTESGEEIPNSKVIFKAISKVDRERLFKVVNGPKFPDVDITLEVICTNCGNKEEHPMRWPYDFFFGAQSLPAD